MISVDFFTRTLCYIMDGYTGAAIEYLMLNVTPEKLQRFAPNYIHLGNDGCYSWNFVDNLFVVNEKIQGDLSDGAMLSPDAFVPVQVIPMPGLDTCYHAFLDAMELCEEDTSDIQDLLFCFMGEENNDNK